MAEGAEPWEGFRWKGAKAGERGRSPQHFGPQAEALVMFVLQPINRSGRQTQQQISWRAVGGVTTYWWEAAAESVSDPRIMMLNNRLQTPGKQFQWLYTVVSSYH